jgi:Fur family ferric uptake transcriptional regulator
MNSEDVNLELLANRDIKPTAIRLLVLKAINDRKAVFSLADLETELETVDKSTLFRTISLFQQHRLIHGFDDGSGSHKFAICDKDCDCNVDQLHVHFLCTHCNRAFCLKDISIPVINMPEGFSAESINYIIKGTCKKCRKFAT